MKILLIPRNSRWVMTIAQTYRCGTCDLLIKKRANDIVTWEEASRQLARFEENVYAEGRRQLVGETLFSRLKGLGIV